MLVSADSISVTTERTSPYYTQIFNNTFSRNIQKDLKTISQEISKYSTYSKDIPDSIKNAEATINSLTNLIDEAINEIDDNAEKDCEGKTSWSLYRNLHNRNHCRWVLFQHHTTLHYIGARMIFNSLP